MKIDVVNMTPTMAKAIMNKNRQLNRKISAARVTHYARMMKAGHWTLNGSTVILDPKENLLDGQHRLMAVIEANTTVPMVVMRGVPQSAMPTIDTGRARKLSDVLGINGQGNTVALASALNMLHGYINNRFRSGIMTLVDNQALLDLLEQHPDIVECLVPGKKIAQQIGSVPRAIITAVYLTRKAAPRLAHEFETGVLTGADLALGDPRLALRKIGRQMVRRNRTDRVKAIEHFALYVKAWNAFIRKEDAQILRVGREEDVPAVLKSDGRPLKIE